MTPTRCSNCGGETNVAHPDMCCLCFCIAFGGSDHVAEHFEYHERKQSATVERSCPCGRMTMNDCTGECGETQRGLSRVQN